MISKEIYIFIGPPGSGKGSLAQRCIEQLGWKQLSTGSLCRQHIAAQTEVGKKIESAIKAGKLIDDQLIVSMVQQWMEENAESENIILDGFPRTTGQAEALNEFLAAKIEYCKLNVIRLCVSDEAIIARLAGRVTCVASGCQAVFSTLPGSPLAPKVPNACDFCSEELVRRSDDVFESIKERLRVYHSHEAALIDFYQKTGQPVHEVNVEKPFEQVFHDFRQVLGIEK